MTTVDRYDRDEERRLLDEWMSTTQFDKESAGVPDLEPEDDDER